AGSANLDSSDRYNDHLLYGAVVGGPSSVDDFSHNDRRNDWVTNEVGTSYNAPFAGAAIQQYDNLGGDPLSESDLDQLIGVDANGTGF
ncbi:MAG: glycoside hydrolase family 9 protein, partial [Cyanobacteria bacterium J06582_2]